MKNLTPITPEILKNCNDIEEIEGKFWINLGGVISAYEFYNNKLTQLIDSYSESDPWTGEYVHELKDFVKCLHKVDIDI